MFVCVHMPWEWTERLTSSIILCFYPMMVCFESNFWEQKSSFFISINALTFWDDNSCNASIGCRNRTFLLSECSLKAYHCGDVNNNGKLCVTALRLPMIMIVSMSQSEMETEHFCLQSNDAKLAIVGMFWMFRNYSTMSLFSCSVFHDFDNVAYIYILNT